MYVIQPSGMSSAGLTAARVPVITSSLGMKHSEPEAAPRTTKLRRRSDHDVLSVLRHTQSAAVVLSRPTMPLVESSARPRALSTGTPSQHDAIYQQTYIRQRIEQHQQRKLLHIQKRRMQSPKKDTSSVYVNIPAPVNSTAANPVYVNIPPPLALRSRAAEPLSPSNIAPRVPRTSYIEIWSDNEDKENMKPSDIERFNGGGKLSRTPLSRKSGYVQMTTPYIRSPKLAMSPTTQAALEDMATKLAEYAGHVPRNIYCPLCPRYFGYEKCLGKHIQEQHKEELNAMVEGRGATGVQLQSCPICQARFFNPSVLPKHLIDFHRPSVVEILEKNNCILSDCTGIQCPFCPKKVSHGK
ncbi:unnamed protein product, partial [Meganyctiphanes norvegica]